MIRVGLIGHGKAGQAVATVLKQDPRFALRWIARRQGEVGQDNDGVPLLPLARVLTDDWLSAHPVDGVIDFSSRESIHIYGAAARARRRGPTPALAPMRRCFQLRRPRYCLEWSCHVQTQSLRCERPPAGGLVTSQIRYRSRYRRGCNRRGTGTLAGICFAEPGGR